MNDLDEIKKVIKNFIYEAKQAQVQISELENQRMQLANQRNEKKQDNTNYYTVDVNALGQKISELGNESQELQNKLNFKFIEVKKIVDLTVDNVITDKIRKIRKMEEEKQEIEEKILNQKGKNAKYEIRKQEFFERFGRVPELSVRAQKEEKNQDEQNTFFKQKIEEIDNYVINMEKELTEFVTVKRNFKNKNWNSIIENKNEDNEEVIQNQEITEEAGELPLMEEFQIEELEPVEYIKAEEFQPIEKIEIGEIEIEPIKDTNEIENVKTYDEQKDMDQIEVLARAIVEEIIAEQTKDLSINNMQEQEKTLFENTEKQESKKEKVMLTDIIAKVEDGEIVYKAQISNGDELKIYPTLEVKNILLNDKEYREEIKEKNQIFDKSVINKIDPTICELLEKFAKKYNYDEKNLINNYVSSFSKENNNDNNVHIIYNFYYLKDSNLSRREKSIISKICRKSMGNKNVDIIGGITGFGKIKYIFKKLFDFNSVKALQEGKY